MRPRDEYLREVEDMLRGRLPKQQSRETIAEAALALDEAFEGLDREETLEEVIEAFGPPADLVSALLEALGHRETGSHSGDFAQADAEILGVPVGVTPITTAERFAQRMWNPRDPRIFVPRLFGIGWDLNFGALAVRLHLLRPDDVEDVTFEAVPTWMTGALAWGSVAALAAAGAYAFITADTLPARIPVHFGLAGPDRFASPLRAAAELLGIGALPVALMAARVFMRRAALPVARVLAAAAMPAITIMSVGFYANAVSWALRGRYLVPSPVPVLVALAVLFGVLLGLTRLGLRKEWRAEGLDN